MENIPGASLVNSTLFPYKILIKCEWKSVRELRGRILSHFSMKPLSEVGGNAPGVPWTNPVHTLLNQILLNVNGNAL